MRLIDADELKRIAGEAHSMKLAMKNAGIGTIAALIFAAQDAGLSTLVRIADDIPPSTQRACGHARIGKMFTKPGLVVFRAGAMLAASEMTSPPPPSGAGILLPPLRKFHGKQISAIIGGDNNEG